MKLLKVLKLIEEAKNIKGELYNHKYNKPSYHMYPPLHTKSAIKKALKIWVVKGKDLKAKLKKLEETEVP